MLGSDKPPEKPVEVIGENRGVRVADGGLERGRVVHE